MINHAEAEQKKYAEMLEENKPSECEACSGPLSLEKINLEDYQGGKLYLMEHVPAYVCQSCGEVWIPEPIMEEFEKMIETVKQKKEAAVKSKNIRTVNKSQAKRHKEGK
ncbi:YgiT-type zinc finger protein [Candidatus Saganbacteria bacterium]|nr:YgiT-type zinc finger protein [Candidatus Saganbacteria bacterium]